MLGRRRFHVQGRAWPLAPLNEPAVEILTAFEAKREDLEFYMEDDEGGHRLDPSPSPSQYYGLWR